MSARSPLAAERFSAEGERRRRRRERQQSQTGGSTWLVIMQEHRTRAREGEISNFEFQMKNEEKIWTGGAEVILHSAFFILHSSFCIHSKFEIFCVSVTAQRRPPTASRPGAAARPAPWRTSAASCCGRCHRRKMERRART